MTILTGGSIVLEVFYPDRYEESVYGIDFQRLYDEGKRGIIFDIDNTLVEHDADANKRSVELFEKLRRIGFKTCLLSNNDEERVKRFNKDINSYYVYKAGKPNKKGYLKAMMIMDLTMEETIFIGDQLFTDIYGAKKLGMDNICTKPIGPKEEIQIVLKRKLEKIVFHSYKKSMKKKAGN